MREKRPWCILLVCLRYIQSGGKKKVKLFICLSGAMNRMCSLRDSVLLVVCVAVLRFYNMNYQLVKLQSS